MFFIKAVLWESAFVRMHFSSKIIYRTSFIDLFYLNLHHIYNYYYNL